MKNAALNTTGITGGIAGEVSNTVIENAICDNVIIDASNGAEIIYIGGIVGIASDLSLIHIFNVVRIALKLVNLSLFSQAPTSSRRAKWRVIDLKKSPC